MPYADPVKRLEKQRTYQRENRVVLLQKQHARIQEQRDFIWEQKKKPCTDCGKEYPPWVMDFDHVRGVKRHNVSRFAKIRASWTTIEEEIAKCEVVCSNCHRERTHGPKNSGE